ncbi:hypothetical protein ABPG72_011861 [Tetrahymena utriculariae]
MNNTNYQYHNFQDISQNNCLNTQPYLVGQPINQSYDYKNNLYNNNNYGYQYPQQQVELNQVYYQQNPVVLLLTQILALLMFNTLTLKQYIALVLLDQVENMVMMEQEQAEQLMHCNRFIQNQIWFFHTSIWLDNSIYYQLMKWKVKQFNLLSARIDIFLANQQEMEKWLFVVSLYNLQLLNTFNTYQSCSQLLLSAQVQDIQYT